MNTLAALFAQKRWANNELFHLLASLPPEPHAALLHQATRTLNHIYVVDRIFQAHLQGQTHPHTSTNTADTPALDALHYAVAEADAWLEHYAAQATAQALQESIAFRFTDGDAGTMRREEMLLHLITHGAYHRGNVGQLLKTAAISPPRDLLTKFLHLREPERRWA